MFHGGENYDEDLVYDIEPFLFYSYINWQKRKTFVKLIKLNLTQQI